MTATAQKYIQRADGDLQKAYEDACNDAYDNPKLLTVAAEIDEASVKLAELESDKESILAQMPNTHFEMKMRDKTLFNLERDIEKIKSPASYEANREHWENYELV